MTVPAEEGLVVVRHTTAQTAVAHSEEGHIVEVVAHLSEPVALASKVAVG